MPRAVLEEALATAQAQRRAATERLEIAEAELVATCASLADLVRIVRDVGGYLRPEDQQAIWAARAQLADAGIVVERPAVRNTR